MKTIVIDRRRFTLELWEGSKGRGELIRAFPIAVGAVGFATRPGVYWVDSKERQPDWRMPDSPWVEKEDRGKIIPGGDPANPLIARWIGLDPEQGIGIHGTLVNDSLGSRASHGCIRMDPDDVRELYAEIPDPADQPTPVVID